MELNEQVSEQFGQYADLLELHGGDAFRARSYGAASFRIDKLRIDLGPMSEAELVATEGIGKSLAGKIIQIRDTGTFPELKALLDETPPGILDMLKLKGIGPKKVKTLWEELGLESLGDLEYACLENRIVSLKGFGEKLQTELLAQIDFHRSQQGKTHFQTAEMWALQLEAAFNQNNIRFARTGGFGRYCEVLEALDYVVSSIDNAKASWPLPGVWGTQDGTTVWKPQGYGWPVFLQDGSEDFDQVVFETIAHPEHLNSIGYEGYAGSDEATYESLGFPMIIPEMREAENSADYLEVSPEELIITQPQIKGLLHNHSTWSDGMHSVEQMAVYCRDMGLEYFGIADHSKAAQYANGLKEDRVMAQWEEIDALNKKLSPFRIFKGIESDILGDGSLDYGNDILSGFDYVVASVHSGLNMTQEKAESRLIRAIENPYTTILGHPTGRLLLSRQGYPIDHKKIIDACAANGVHIELNAHPYRLDMDWRWLWYARKKAVMISINPDAHQMAGLEFVRFGILAARKGGLLTSQTLNALGLEEINKRFEARQKILK